MQLVELRIEVGGGQPKQFRYRSSNAAS
jgi:hypothetical protein